MKTEQTTSAPVPAIAQSNTTQNGKSVKNLLSGSKEFLPWILAACQFVSWFGVKYLTSDRMQQQQLDDHAALAEVRTQLAELKVSESKLGGKLDVLLELNYKGK